MTPEEAKNYSLYGDAEGFYYQEARERIANSQDLDEVHLQALERENVKNY